MQAKEVYMSMQARSETPVASVRWVWWSLVFLVLIASFVVSFAVSAPADWIVNRFNLAVSQDAVSGTVAEGQIALDGGFVLGWQARPWTSLMDFRLVVDVTVQGPQTDIAVPLALGLSSYEIGPVIGSADAALAQAVFPYSKLRCSGPVLPQGFVVQVSNQTVTGAGGMRSGDLDCGTAAAAALVPPLTLGFTPLAEGTMARITAGPLIVATATAEGDGRLKVILHKDGAALFTGLPSSADSSIDLPLSSLFR
jgi:hypothetical protein